MSQRLPVCSALALSIEATREFNRTTRRGATPDARRLTKDVRNVVGVAQPILKLVQEVKLGRRSKDSWMPEE